MVKLRFKRFGRRNRPFFRLTAIDSRRPRNGSPIEELGMYDPLEKDQAKGLRLNLERIQYWLKVGARPSETVYDLLRKLGVALPPRKIRKSKPQPPKPVEAKA